MVALLLPLPLLSAPLCPNQPASAWIAAGEEPLEGPEWSDRLACSTGDECADAVARLTDPTPEVVAARVREPAGQALLTAPVLVRVELECEGTGRRAEWTCDADTCALVVVEPAFVAPMQAHR